MITSRYVLVAALAAWLVGCANEGLTLGSGEQPGLRGSFVRDGVVVQFEALRGEALDPAVDPDGPQYAVDVRIADGAGETFLLQSGGHAQSDPGWQLGTAEVDPEARNAVLALVPAAMEALRAATLEGDLEPERAAVLELGATVADLEPAQPARAAVYCDTGYTHSISVRYKAATLSVGGCTVNVANFQHSATRMCSYRVYSNCSTALQGCNSSCNHGTCWASMSSTSCSWSTLRQNQYPPYQDENSTGLGVSGGCKTSYAPCPGHHLCNNDSKLQYNNVRNNTTYNAYTTTECVVPRFYSPSC